MGESESGGTSEEWIYAKMGIYFRRGVGWGLGRGEKEIKGTCISTNFRTRSYEQSVN